MTGLIGFLPLACAWPAMFWLARELGAQEESNSDWRLSWAFACAGFGTALTVIVEVSSRFHQLNALTIAILWTVFDLIVVVTVVRLARRRGAPWWAIPAACWRGIRNSTVGGWPVEAKLFLGVTVAFTAFSLGIALTTPTTNGDSLAYHLPRMVQWIQHQSVDHFPTDDVRQLEFGPWSSFAMTNLFLLTGSDRLLNGVQWFAMVSTLIFGSFIVERLGWLGGWEFKNESDRARTAAFGGLLMVTLPIGLVQSITTQNDYTTACWLCALVCFALALWSNPGSLSCWLGAGLSCGLGALTKATTYVYAAPLILVGGFLIFRRVSGWPFRWRRAAIFTVAFLGLNAQHMLRNYALFGSPMGSPEIITMERNERVSPAVAWSNLTRNLALHANGGIPWVTRRLNATLSLAHEFSGQDLNDPATTFERCHFTFGNQFQVFDSKASCSYHVLLILSAGGIALWHIRRSVRALAYGALFILSLILFCAALKWQPWHSRLHLAYFAVLMPLAALILTRSCPAWSRFAIAAGVVAFGVFSVAQNRSRPIFNSRFLLQPREQQYLVAHDSDLKEPLARLADRIVASGCRQVGLKAGFCGVEYPLWAMLRNRGFDGVYARCFVENQSGRIPSPWPKPCVVITTFQGVPEELTREYPFRETYGRLNVFWADPPVLDGFTSTEESTKEVK